MENQDHVTSVTSRNALSGAELILHLRTRVWKDDALRQEFLTNPKAVLERDYAQWFPEGKIPSELSIKIIEEEKHAIYFLLPPRAADDHAGIIENQDHVPSVTSQNALTRAELILHLRARVRKDDALRQEFLTNPKAVLERDYAQCFSEDISEFSIKVIEEEEQAIYFLLPPKAADDHPGIEEIHDEDLFDMSGGTTSATICGCYTHGSLPTCCTCFRRYCTSIR